MTIIPYWEAKMSANKFVRKLMLLRKSECFLEKRSNSTEEVFFQAGGNPLKKGGDSDTTFSYKFT